MRYVFAAAFTVALATAPALAGNWNESVNGDLSNDNLAPTPITLAVGVNHFVGTIGRDLPQNPVDRDIFKFTLQPGQVLSSIEVQFYDPANQSFFAIAPGASINDSSGTSHYANTLVKQTGELIPQLRLPSYSGTTLGLPDPIGAGTYTVWFQETSGIVTYDIAYMVEAVPEAGSLTTFGFGLFAFLLRRRKIQPAVETQIKWRAHHSLTSSANNCEIKRLTHR